MGFLYFIAQPHTVRTQRQSPFAMPQKLTLHHMWGGCPHVTDITGNIEPATLQPATVTLHQAKLVPARSNGFTVIYKNALFPDRTEEQEFVPGATGGYHNAAKGNFSGGAKGL